MSPKTSAAAEKLLGNLTQLTKEGEIHWVGSVYPYDPHTNHFLIPCYFTTHQNHRLEMFLRPVGPVLKPTLTITTVTEEKVRVLFRHKTVERSESRTFEEDVVANLWKVVQEKHHQASRWAVAHANNRSEKELQRMADGLVERPGV